MVTIGAWTKLATFLAIAALSLGTPAASDPTVAPPITNFNTSDRIDPFTHHAQLAYSLTRTTKRDTSIRAKVTLARIADSGGSSLGVCYHGGPGSSGRCAQLETDNTGCLAANTSPTVTKRLEKSFVNTHIEIHANRNPLCIDWIGFGYGGGNMHPTGAKIVATGDLTFECGHPWAYSGRDSNGFHHKCLFIGNVETQRYTNTYTFDVDKLNKLTYEVQKSQEKPGDYSYIPGAVTNACSGIGSWSRKDLPQTSPDCDKYDNNFGGGGLTGARKTIKYVSEEVHNANLLINPNYTGNPPVNGTIEIETF
ncbi:hypothetical protein BGX29_009617 [Mortierella sp. GBA35]|nr:hypothetical protein BGX29_009617 [Mortierella sp. GBA35]